jgi:replicative DNA helicase
VLGAALLDPSAADMVIERMHADDFFRLAHQRVFEAIRDLAGRGVVVDLVTVADYLGTKQQLESIGGPATLADLTAKVASASNVEAYIQRVTSKTQLRRLIAAAAQIQQECFEHQEDPAMVVDHAAALVLDATDSRSATRPRDAAEVVMRTLDVISANKKREGIQMSTGFTALDSMLLGFHPGQMVVVAGRPGMGKTALALNFALDLALRQGLPGAVFSLEMQSEDLMLRMLSSMSSVDFHALRSGRLREDELRRVTMAAEKLSSAPMYITEPGRLDLDGIRANLRRMKRQLNIRWVVIDYLGLVNSGLRRVDTRAQEIGYISRTLKHTFLDLGLAGIVAAQLNRESVRTTGSETVTRRPRLSDLRDSGEIEQDADNVLMLHRTDADLDAQGDLEAEIIIAKQRQGRTGTVSVVWQGHYVRFQPAVPVNTRSNQ